ncbi:MAG: hypothetical protein ACFFAU_20670, partial [Candidatus Hodarchaeota archaeon]
MVKIMKRKKTILQKLDNLWVYLGLFSLSLALHYLTPYFQSQPIPDFFRSVIYAPLYEEFVYRFLGIMIAFYSLKKIVISDSIRIKIDWGMIFVFSAYIEIAKGFLIVLNASSLELFSISLVCTFLILGILLIAKDYQIEIIIFVSSFTFAFVHEHLRFIPVFVAGIFFSLLCVHRSRITLFDNQTKKTKLFLLIYGIFPGYLIHLWNNFLNWLLYQQLLPILIDLLSVISMTVFLFLLEKFAYQIIDEKCKIRHETADNSHFQS